MIPKAENRKITVAAVAVTIQQYNNTTIQQYNNTTIQQLHSKTTRQQDSKGKKNNNKRTGKFKSVSTTS